MTDLVGLENRAAKAASAPLRQALDQLSRYWLALYLTVSDALRPSVLAGLAAELSAMTAASEMSPMQTAAAEAAAIGAQQAATRLGLGVPFGVELPKVVGRAIERSNRAAAEELRKAAAMVRTARDVGDLTAALAVARRSVGRVEAAARFAVNRSLSAGTRAVVAGTPGVNRLWIAERDACLHCLAYAGHVAIGTAAFPGGLSFAKKPLPGKRVADPPLHPNCRCRVVAFPGGADDAYALGLRREAVRSVLRGWSLPSESEAARLRAAGAMLSSTAGQAMPKTVREYARQAVRHGHFARGRTFPA